MLEEDDGGGLAHDRGKLAAVAEISYQCAAAPYGPFGLMADRGYPLAHFFPFTSARNSKPSNRRKSMNVHVRFFTVTALVALAASARPLAAQQASPAGTDEASSASAVAVTAQTAANATRETRTPSVTSALPAAVAVPVAAAPRGPSVASARVASHAVSAPIGAPPVIQNRSSNRNAVALMAVGGAALVVGAVIGEDAGTLVMLGGAVVGLYGLYLFLT